jgi:hypothetical protein
MLEFVLGFKQRDSYAVEEMEDGHWLVKHRSMRLAEGLCLLFIRVSAKRSCMTRVKSDGCIFNTIYAPYRAINGDIQLLEWLVRLCDLRECRR